LLRLLEGVVELGLGAHVFGVRSLRIYSGWGLFGRWKSVECRAMVGEGDLFVALFYLPLFFVIALEIEFLGGREMETFLVISMIVVDEAKKEHWHVEPDTGGGVSAYTLGSVVL